MTTNDMDEAEQSSTNPRYAVTEYVTAEQHKAALAKVDELTAERGQLIKATASVLVELGETQEHLALDRQAVATLREREQNALAQLARSREQAATYANEIGTLTAENARVRQQRDNAAEAVAR